MIRSLALTGVLFIILLAFGAASQPRLDGESRRVPPFHEKSAPTYSTFDVKPPVFASFGAREAEPSEAANNFLGLGLEAQSVYVFDLSSRRTLFEKNAFEPRPLASLAKLMTALLAEELIPPSVFVPISVEAVRQEGDSGFMAGEKFKKEDLRDFMLTASSNDAAYAFAEFIGAGIGGEQEAAVLKFAALMNERARELEMFRTSFLTPHGLDQFVNNQESSGADGTAYEMALLAEYLYKTHPRILTATRQPEIKIISEEGRELGAPNTNRASGIIPQLIGAKTGFTELAGGNLVFIFDAGFSRPVLVSLLGSSENGRFKDAKKIVEAVLNYYQNSLE
ncbi:MAG: hypothetical protein Q8R12_01935 [bacterium]|nr:hypothetical protein [bacterium]